MSKELLRQLRAEQDSSEALTRGSSGNSSTRCYRVQARMCIGCAPRVVNNNTQSLTDTRWETLHFAEGTLGVPASKCREEYASHGYISYSAAQALRWWFLAEEKGIGGIETRLVEYTFKYSYSAEPVRAICMIDPEKREHILPDWGNASEKEKGE